MFLKGPFDKIVRPRQMKIGVVLEIEHTKLTLP
jgi:hypothetical protein